MLYFSLLAVNFPQGSSPCNVMVDGNSLLVSQNCFLGRQMNGPDILIEEILICGSSEQAYWKFPLVLHHLPKGP